MASRTIVALVCLAAAVAAVMSAQPPGSAVTKILAAVERRYNTPRTLEMRFEQRFRGGGQPSRVESGILFLKKPGRMRWEYRSPEGKLFVVDGKQVWFYSPAMNQVERSPLKASEDLRTPLAFLMGRLDFQRDFTEFRSVEEGDLLHITGVPRSKNSPYREVEFWVTPVAELKQVAVQGLDSTTMIFRFEGERLNAPVGDQLFTYTPPPGVPVVDAAKEESREVPDRK